MQKYLPGLDADEWSGCEYSILYAASFLNGEICSTGKRSYWPGVAFSFSCLAAADLDGYVALSRPSPAFVQNGDANVLHERGGPARELVVAAVLFCSVLLPPPRAEQSACLAAAHLFFEELTAAAHLASLSDGYGWSTADGSMIARANWSHRWPPLTTLVSRGR